MSKSASTPSSLFPQAATSFFRRLFSPALVRTMVARLVGALLGFVVGGILILIAGANPIEAYRIMIEGAVGGPRQITETLLKAAPLLIMGLGLTVAFRSKMWNIGGEGQYLMGALGAVLIALPLQHILPAILLIPLMFVSGMLFGAAWAGVAAWLKVKRGVSEIISTLMLSYIALFSISYLARGPLRDSASFLPQSADLVGAARMPVFPGTRIHLGVVLAALLVPTIYVLLWKTSLGFRLRAIGSSESVSRYAGMNVAWGLAFALLFSGALAGITGVMEVSASFTRLKDGIASGYGFTGILVSLLGRKHPFGVLLSALFYAALLNGAQTMQSLTGLPSSVAQVIQALIVLFVLGADAYARRRWR
jgi:ABC-type uncharacterized transport system permease subunit